MTVGKERTKHNTTSGVVAFVLCFYVLGSSCAVIRVIGFVQSNIEMAWHWKYLEKWAMLKDRTGSWQKLIVNFWP